MIQFIQERNDLKMLALLKARRSIRKYEDKEVDKEKIDNILKAALLSPSSRSIRPWEFICVTNKELLQKLSKSREHGSQFIAGAPLCIVIIANQEACDVWIEDASIAATIIQLNAQSQGLGSCWVQVRERFYSGNIKTEEYIKQILNIPEKYRVECMVGIGYPAEDKKPYEESDLHYEKIHFNTY